MVDSLLPAVKAGLHAYNGHARTRYAHAHTMDMRYAHGYALDARVFVKHTDIQWTCEYSARRRVYNGYASAVDAHAYTMDMSVFISTRI